ncbi:hypothetical protein DYL61_16560 [Pseudomonas nabeulensis]|uniref:Uncharacterized protein n=1 Tax=Pseudomonas nabeulensis TaxID=2293833 RepID=A0A4Z0B211_9PSED|nr:hypothetical protein DYL61_16560 [Pseudomonas nabeulensis]
MALQISNKGVYHLRSRKLRWQADAGKGVDMTAHNVESLCRPFRISDAATSWQHPTMILAGLDVLLRNSAMLQKLFAISNG